MAMFHNLFTWEIKEPRLTQCIFKECKLCVPLAGLRIGDPVGIIVQDYLKCILIVKTFEGTTHIPYRVHIDSLEVVNTHPDRITQMLVERLDMLEKKIATLSK